MEEQPNMLLVKEVMSLLMQMRKALVVPLRMPVYDVSPTQMMVLCTVEAYEVLNMTQISTEMAISNQQLTHLVEGLVEKGYVQRVPDPNNRRANLVSLTTKGGELLSTHREHVINAIYPALGDIPEDKFERLFKSVKELKDIVRQIALPASHKKEG